MKKSLLMILTVLLVAIVAATGVALAGEVYTYSDDNGVVFEYRLGYDYSTLPNIQYAEIFRVQLNGNTDVVIPDTMDGYPVQIIGSYAFEDQSTLKSVMIPDGVKAIYPGAFFNCTSLKTIGIPDSVTNMSSYIFDGCSSLESISYPDGVRYVLLGTCSSLNHIDFPADVEEIAITDCDALESITIPNTAARFSIRDCDGLKTVTIPEDATSIPDYAFTGCSGLTSLKIPSSVTSIGLSAFSGCKSLTNIEVPTTVESAYHAFEGTKNSLNIIYRGTDGNAISSFNRVVPSSTLATSITLKWPRFTKASAYKVYKYNDLERKWKLLTTIDDANTNSYKVTGLKANTSYNFKVTSVIDGKSYSSTAEYVCTNYAKPKKVINLKLTTGTTHYVKAAWDYTDAVGYQIQIATNSTFTKGLKTYKYYSNGTTYKKVTKLTKGKKYYVRVRAFNYKQGSEDSGTQYGSWSLVKYITCK